MKDQRASIYSIMKESKENRDIGHSSYSFTGTGRCLSAVFLVVSESRRILAIPKLGLRISSGGFLPKVVESGSGPTNGTRKH